MTEVKYGIKDLRMTLDDKVSYGDMQRSLNQQASKYELQNLQTTIQEQYCTLEKAAEIEMNLQFKIDQTKESIHENFYTKYKIDQIFMNYKVETQDSFLGLNNFDQYQFKIKETMEKIKTITSGLENRLKQVESHSSSLMKQIQKKTEVEETQKIQEEMKFFCKYDDLKDLYNKVMPPLQNFEDKMYKMSQSYEQSMEIIRRYDEIIAEKASKTTIIEIYQYIKSYLLEEKHSEYVNKNEQDKQTLNKEIEKLQTMLQALSENIGKDIFTAVRRATQTIQNQTSSKGGGVGVGDFDSSQLKVMLNQKADKSEIDLINDLKSNKIDTEQTMRGIDILHKQMTHLIVLFVEFLKNGLRNHFDNEKTKEKKKLILLQQSLSVCNWINQFNPQNINNDDLILPPELQELTEYAKLLVAEFPKLDQTAENTFKKFKVRENSLSLDASYQVAPQVKKFSPSNVAQREIAPSQQLNIYLANTIQSARYSNKGQNQFYPLKMKKNDLRGDRNKVRYSSLKNELEAKSERESIPNYLEKLIKEQNAQNKSMMIKEPFHSHNQSKILLSEESNGSFNPNNNKHFQNQVNFPLIK